MGLKRNPVLSSAGIIALLLLGVLATGYGFSALSASDATGTWRWTFRYLFIFAAVTVVIAMIGARIGATAAGLAVVAGLSIILGAAVPLIVVSVLAMSAFVLGRLLLRNTRMAASDSLLVGIVVMGSALSLLVHFPVNNAGTWGLLFCLPLVLGWRYLRDVVPQLARTTRPERHSFLLECAIGASLVPLMLVGLMPEIGHDALVYHLFVPAHVAQHQSWHFNAQVYSWAVIPLFVDWLYTASYMFAGEQGARMMNIGGILLMAALVRRLALWAGANRDGANWAVLLLLVMPLTFLESSSLFVESIWSALLLGGTLALLRLLTQPQDARTEILLAGVLLGGAIAAKALTFVALPVLALMIVVGGRRWFSSNLLSVTGLALLLMLLIGAAPYATAYVNTGNPVFPFFNAYFKSPLYPIENFSPPAIFERGVSFNTLYRMTFESGRYLEATAGAPGFQWLMLAAPGAAMLVAARQGRALLLMVLGFSWLWLTFAQTAYLRYVFPSFALACAAVAIVLKTAAESGRWASRAAVSAAIAVVVLNLLHLHAGTYYEKIDPKVILNARARQAYIESTVPVRAAVDLVNSINRTQAPVVFFSPPLTAGLRADAIYSNWYNPRFQAAVSATKDAAGIGRLLSSENVEYVVLDDAMKGLEFYPWVLGATTEVAKIGPVSVRRIGEGYRYTEELLSPLDLETGWQMSPGSARPAEGGVQVTVAAPAYSVVPVSRGGRYRYTADARCAADPAQGRLQVNWLRADGNLARADIEVFDCKAAETTYAMDVSAPSDAVQAQVYASAHGHVPVIFSRVSFKK